MKALHLMILHIFAITLCSYALAQPCPITTDMRHSKPSIILTDDANITSDPTGIQGSASRSPDDKLIYWIHGMRGGNGSWSAAATATENTPLLGSIPGYPARKAKSYRLGYENNEFSLDIAASKVKQEIGLVIHPENPNYDYSDAIIVAHSQGSLASRVFEKKLRQDNDLGSLKCGGMAFFGGPHLGSPALKDFEATGKLFTTKMATDLSSGPLKSKIINNRKTLVRLIAKWIKVDEWYDDAVEAIVSPLTNIIFDQNISELAMEMGTGSPQLNNLNDPASPPSVPMVAFYGDLRDIQRDLSQDPDVEDFREIQVVWSTMQWMLNSPNSGGFFHAQVDWELQLQVSDWQMEYFDQMQYERAVQNLTFNNKNCWWWSQSRKRRHLNSTGVNPWTYCKYSPDNTIKQGLLAILRERDYAIGYEWFNSANNQWKVIIGALSTKEVDICECTHEYYDYNSGRSDRWTTTTETLPGSDCSEYEAFSYDNPNEREIVTCEKLSRDPNTWIEKRSDGLVLDESAGGMPGSHLVFEPRRMLGSSHFGMRNDDNLRIQLNWLWSGLADNVFAIEPRN